MFLLKQLLQVLYQKLILVLYQIQNNLLIESTYYLGNSHVACWTVIVDDL